MRTSVFNVLGATLAFTLLAGCGQQAADEAATKSPTVDASEPAISVYAAAVSSTTRPDKDRERDAGRKPAEILEFMGIKPGMTVFDMFSGSGWYAEIIATVVGDSGHVIAHTNTAYKGFVGDALEERFSGDRHSNVEILLAENNQLVLEENSLDAVMLIQSFHDLYHVDVAGNWEKIDAPAFLAEVKKGLKPGGIVAIVDHAAIAGAPPETGDSLHRIDPAIVVARMEAAGFICEASSDILSNPDDDLTQMVFAEGIRGKTTRFAMRFRSPE